LAPPGTTLGELVWTRIVSVFLEGCLLTRTGHDRTGQGHTARMGGTSTCCGAFFWLSWALIRAAASAAAAAASLLGPDPSTLFATGLRLRVARSLSRCDGERERRSNLLRRGGSGSAWSKRERLRGSSPMLDGCSRWRVCEGGELLLSLGGGKDAEGLNLEVRWSDAAALG
jgi:hypothetical protein